jgi:hypothetical protein
MKKNSLTFLILLQICSAFAQKNRCEKIGMNLSGISYWSREVPFSNLMMQAAPWSSTDLDWKLGQANHNTAVAEKLTYDTNGYPDFLPQTVAGQAKMQIVKTTVAWDNGGILPKGVYTILYDGSGEIEPYGDDKIKNLTKTKGKITFELSPSKFDTAYDCQECGSFGIILRTSEKSNPIKNIRILMPNVKETDSNYPFNPFFLDRLKPFSSIRFMNWNAAYSSKERQWSERIQATHYTQFNAEWNTYNSKSVAYEYAIKLCNILHRDMWLNIPYAADSNYIYQLSKLVKNNLDPKLNIYLEYGNEVWNNAGAFSEQYNFVKNNAPSNLPEHQYRYAYFSKKMFQAFAAYTPTTASPKVTRVLSGQQANKDVLERSIKGMAFLGAAGQFDKGSVTGYLFGNELFESKLNAISTVTDVAKMVRTESQKSVDWIAENAIILQQSGKDLLIYEGGVHSFVAYPQWDIEAAPSYAKAVWKFNKDTSLYNIYSEWLQKLDKIPNIGQNMAFALSEWDYAHYGSLGHLSNIFASNFQQQPKYKALIDYCGVTVSDKDIKEKELEENVQIFPNPTEGILNIRFEKEGIRNVEIYDLTGRFLFDKRCSNQSEIIDLEGFTQGFYLIKIDNQLHRIVKM